MGTDRTASDLKGKAKSGKRGEAPARRVLLVGDKPFFAALRQRLLRSGELKVLAAVTGGEAMKVALANPPHAIFLNAELPDLDGFEVCRRLRDDPFTEAVPVVLLTDTSKPQVNNRTGFESSAVATVPMSIDPERLLNIIQMVLTTPLSRRTAPRATVALNVAYKFAEHTGTATTLNLSVGGMFIVTPNPPEVGTHLAVRFVLPPSASVEGTARVVWTRRPEEEHPYPVGMVIQFLELPPAARPAISAFVASVLAAPVPSREA
jgi:uncharacterized protein (TIGR02266 family)